MFRDCVVHTVKHDGGFVMVGGCFNSAGIWDLVKVDDIMRKENYRQILEKTTVRFKLRLIEHNFMFVHDNDPAYSTYLQRILILNVSRRNKPFANNALTSTETRFVPYGTTLE